MITNATPMLKRYWWMTIGLEAVGGDALRTAANDLRVDWQSRPAKLKNPTREAKASELAEG